MRALILAWFSLVRRTQIGTLALLLGTSHVALAGINVWTSHGPYDGAVYALAIDPSTPSTLYAGYCCGGDGTDGGVGGVFKSVDAGATWSAANTGLPTHAAMVLALAIDPSTPSTLYALMFNSSRTDLPYNGVFKSTNGGASWTALNTGLPNVSYVSALAIDPHTPSTLYAGSGTNAGSFGRVFDIEQVSACVGDCSGTRTVAIDDLITLVNIALGTAEPSVCSNGGLPIGGDVTIAVLIQAVNHALSSCPAG